MDTSSSEESDSDTSTTSDTAKFFDGLGIRKGLGSTYKGQSNGLGSSTIGNVTKASSVLGTEETTNPVTQIGGDSAELSYAPAEVETWENYERIMKCVNKNDLEDTWVDLLSEEVMAPEGVKIKPHDEALGLTHSEPARLLTLYLGVLTIGYPS